MTEPSERLQEARRKAGFDRPTDAARAFGWNPVTYLAHENGGRGLRADIGERYARAFRVPVEWLMYGRGKDRPVTMDRPLTVPLIGYVAAGAEAHFLPAGDLGEVEAPHHATDRTVAVEIRGESLGSLFDRWLVFYDDVRRPITSDLFNKLCVVGLADERVLIKQPRPSRSKGLFHLYSQTEDPILDQEIVWAALVKSLSPR